MRNRGAATTIVSLTLSLILLGVFGYAYVLFADRGSRALDSVFGQVCMSVVVQDSLSTARLGEIESLIAANREVERIVFVSADEARAQFEGSIGEQIKLGVQLPASFDVYYRGGSVATARLLSKFTDCQGVRDVVCDPTIAHSRDRIEASLARSLIVSASCVVLVVLVLLYFVIGGWVARSSGDSGAMVGRAFSIGAISGVLGAISVVLVDQYMIEELPSLALGVRQTLLVGSIVVLAGVLLSTLFTYMSIKTLQR